MLRTDAILIYKDGISDEVLDILRVHKGEILRNRLNLWVQQWISLRSLPQSLESRGNHQASTLLQIINDIGFADAVRNQWLTWMVDDDNYPQGSIINSYNLLAVSRHRNPWRPEDHVYGIMQVFDIRLGGSTPEVIRLNNSVEELVDQLGVELLKKYPISSQLIIQSPDCPDNRIIESCCNPFKNDGEDIYDVDFKHLTRFLMSRIGFGVTLHAVGNYLRCRDKHEIQRGVDKGMLQRQEDNI